MSLFGFGYSGVHSRLSKKSKYTMSCYNCNWYYQTPSDLEETCQNPDVLPYDVTVDEYGVCCSKYEPIRKNNSAKLFFRKRGDNDGIL